MSVVARETLLDTTAKTKVWLERDGQFVLGDGGLLLLLGILEHGSLLGAARQIPLPARCGVRWTSGSQVKPTFACR